MDAKIDIYGISGDVICSVLITKDAVSHEELMTSDYIQLSWNDDKTIVLPAGAYIIYQDEKYSLIEPYLPLRENEAEYKYTPQFHSRIMIWDKIPVPLYTYESDGLTIKSREMDWDFTGSPADAMYMVKQAIKNETGEDWTIQLSESLPATITISSQSTSIFSNLNNIAEECETEWWTDKKTNTLYLSECKYGTPLKLIVGENVCVPSVSESKDGYYTRFYAFGSTRNITQEYDSGQATNHIANKRLGLNPTKYPGGFKDIKGHFENGVFTSDLMPGEIFIKTLFFDKIFPSSKLTISDVRARLKYRLDNNGNKIKIGGTDDEPVYEQYAIWYFQIENFNFDKESIIDGKNLSVSFESGQLAGRDFELKYYDKPEKKNDEADVTTFEIKTGDYEIIIDESTGNIIPGLSYIIPQNGDQIILFNIIMPSEYVSSAQNELEKELDKAISDASKDNNSYEVESYPENFYEHSYDTHLGQEVNFYNGDNILNSRILMVEKHLDFQYEQTIRIGNEHIKGNTQELKEEVANVNQNIDIIKAFNELSTSLSNAYANAQREMIEGFAAIKNIWEFDNDESHWSTDNNGDKRKTIKSKYNVWSSGYISALGTNTSEDSSGTGSFDLLQDWDKYVDSTAKSMALSAFLGKDLLDRVISLEEGQKGHNITISGSGNVVVNVEESSDGGTLTFTKGNIDLSGYATTTALAEVSKKTDAVTTKVNDFLEGTDTDNIINRWKELEAFLAGQTQTSTLAELLEVKADKNLRINAGTGLAGGGSLSADITLTLATVGTEGTYTKVVVDKYGRVTDHATLSAGDIPMLDISKISGLQGELDKKLNINDFGSKFAAEMANWFKKDTEGNVFVANSKGFYSESFVSAMGKSSGGSSSGGGSYDRLDNWADYSADRATWVLSAKLGYDLNTRVSSLESGSAINFETSGTGNALTGFSKSGNTVTFTKGTFLTEHQKLYTLTMQRNGEGVGSYVPTADKIININACTAINVPQGFTAGALSSVGVIALSFASGYSLPTTAKQQQWDTAYSFVESIAGSDANGVIDKWNEIISFLDGIGDSSTLEGLLNDINSNVTAVSSRVTKLEGYFVNGVAKEAAKTTGTLSINGKNFNGSASVNVGVIGVSYGGTGKSSVASGSMLYASAANTYAELATTEFGRNLLKANSGSVVSGLNADMLDGVHINGLFTAAGWNTQTLTITIGGVTKSVTIPYASASVVGLVSTAAQTFGGTKTFNAGLIVPAGQSLKIGNGTITWDSTKGCFHFSHGLYSDSFISAMGLNDSGSGGGSASYERLDNWTDYAEEKATWVLSAKLGNELNERLKSVEAGGATSVVTTGTGNVITAISKNGNTITATKGITALTSHQAIYSLTLQGNGTTIGTFNPKSANATINITAANIGAAAASHTHTLSALSDLKAGWSTLLKEDPKAYVTRWPAFSEVTSKPTTLAGYGITDAYTKTDADSRYVNVSGDTMTGHLKFNPGIQATWSVKGTSYITNGNTDSGTTVGGDLANLVISSWFGVSFTTACAEQPYTNKTAVGIDCRNGIVKAAMFAGNLQGNADTATNADKLDGVHLGGLFTDFSTSNESTNITIGGVTKSLKINADTLDGLHEASFNRIYGRYSISTTGTAPYNYIHLFRIACSNGYATLRVDVDFKSRYHAGLLAIDITTQEFPYGDSAGHGTAIKISKDSINGRTGQFYWIRTTQESGYNYYDIYYKSGAWNTGRFDLRVRGGSGTLVFEVKGTNLNSLPEGCTEVLDTTYSGTASNAVKLATPRTLWGQSFDGSANVSGNIYDTQIVQSVSGKYLDLKGAAGLGFYTQNTVKAVIQPNGNFGIGTTNPLYKLHVLGNIYAEAAGIISTAGDAFRLAYGNYGTILRSDGGAFYILATNKGEASNGTFNKFRPFRFDLATGGVNLVQTGESLTVGGDTQFNKSVSIGNGKIEWDEANKAFKFTGGIYSDSYISAMGLNAAGGSGGSYERLDSWSDYTEDKATWVLSALLGSNLNTRVSALEAGGATSVVTSGTGNVVTAVTKSGNVITATKGITALTSHQNIYALTLQGNGSTIGTFNPKTGNSTINITAANIGAAASSHTHNYLPLTGGTITGELSFKPTDSSDAAPKIYSSTAEGGVTNLNFAVADDGNDSFIFRMNYYGNTNEADRERFIINWYGVTSKAAITAPSFNGNLNGNASTASKLATARTINGTNFDGSVNITTSYWGTARNIYIQDATAAHTGAAVSVNGSGNINLKLPSTITAALSGNASTASKWQTARTVTMNGFADCSFSIDGSSNVSFDYKPYNFHLSVGNKNNYPWHRIAKVELASASYQDFEAVILLSHAYDKGMCGIIRITLRTNDSASVSNAHVDWLSRSGFDRTDVKIGLYNVYGKTYADVFLKTKSYYIGVTGVILTQGWRGNLARKWTLVNSSEVNNTTATDKLTSTECWASIEVAAEELHKQAYTNIIEADDAGGVGILYDHGKLTAISGTTMPNEGLRLYRAYNNGYPAAYGNLMSVRGENSGAGELLLEWKGSTELGHIYYRSKRDNTSSGWSSWGTLAFLTDNVASATKLQTARSINGTSFDGTANITTAKWGSYRTVCIQDNARENTGAKLSVDGSTDITLLMPSTANFSQLTISSKLISNGQTDFNKQWLKNVGGIWFGSADSSSVFASFDGDGTQTGLQSKVGTSIYFGWRGGTRAMTIDSAGNVVIGNTSTVNSAYKLDVKGDVRTQGDIVPYSNGQYNIGSSGARWNTLFTQSIELYGFTPYIDFHFNNSSADYTSRIVEVVSGCLAINGTLAVLKSGNVGIGTTLPTEKLYVSGNIAATGAVTALVLSSSSDIRLKDIRKNVCLSVEEIAKAPAVEFAWKKTGDLAVGSIAQYWQPILPQAIHKRDNYLSMQYDVIALLASIANARRILSIEKKIKELEEEVKRLKIS